MVTFNLDKLSDSRIFFLGALGATTLGTGPLATWLFAPNTFQHSPVAKLILLALALTVPTVMFASFVIFTAMREKLAADEKARRAVTLGSLACGMSQLIVIAFLPPVDLRAYWATSSTGAVLLSAMVFLVARAAQRDLLRRRRKVRHQRQVERRSRILAEQMG